MKILVRLRSEEGRHVVDHERKKVHEIYVVRRARTRGGSRDEGPTSKKVNDDAQMQRMRSRYI